MKRKAADSLQLQFKQNMSNLRGATDETKSDSPYDYDLAVIGGGSGGMAAAKEAARNGARVRIYSLCTILVVIIVKFIFIHSFLFYCVLYNHSFQTNPALLISSNFSTTLLSASHFLYIL